MPSSSPMPWPLEEFAGRTLGPLGRKAVVVGGGKVFQFAAWIVALAVLARRLDQEAFGVFQQSWLLIATLTPILLLGLPQSLNYLLPRANREEGRQIVWLALGLILGIAALVGMVLWRFPTLAVWMVDNPSVAELVPVLVIVLLMGLPGQLFEPLAILKERQYWLLAMQMVYWALFAAAAVVLGARGDFQTFFLAIAALGLARTLAAGLFIQAHFGVWNVGMDLKHLKRLGGVSAFLGLVAIADVLSVQIDKYVVCHFFGVERFALYGVGAIELPLIPLMLGAVTATLIPELSRLLGQNRGSEALALVQRSIARLGSLIFPVFFYLLLFGPLWIETIFGSRYRDAGPVFLVYLFILPLRALNAHPLFIAGGMQQFLLRGRIMDFTINLVLSIWLCTTPLGLLGPAVATVVATLAHKIYQSIVLAGRFQLRLRSLYPWRDLAIPAVRGCVAAALTWLVLDLLPEALLARLGLGSLVYGAYWFFMIRWARRRK